MSLYHEAASILDSLKKQDVSLKTVVFGKKTWKTDTKTLFALTSEAAKWSNVLSEVIENSGLISIEKQLSPTLAVVLAHDLLLSKKGIALPSNHRLHTIVSRHKTRLNAELTRTRIRRNFDSLEALRANLNQAASVAPGRDAHDVASSKHPRWIRVNTILTTLEEQLKTTFADLRRVSHLHSITQLDPGTDANMLYVDEHIPNLVAVPSIVTFTDSKAYRQGYIIFQDKASCFPAYLLDPGSINGRIIDACAAPGNKTTHLAAILKSRATDIESDSALVIACEKDPVRSQTLTKMVRLAGAHNLVTIKSSQNFLKLNPTSSQFANVTALLLDPSCSGSGIVGREEGGFTVHLPSLTTTPNRTNQNGRKRKRGKRNTHESAELQQPEPQLVEEASSNEEPADIEKIRARLEALADFQLRLLQHAMSFSAALRITYSTCSLHAEENENVVVRALTSDIAIQRGWEIMKRQEQVDGMRRWHIRGDVDAVAAAMGHSAISLTENGSDIADACLRCSKHSQDGTMGFFVAGFRRQPPKQALNGEQNGSKNGIGTEESEEDWSGFDD